MRYRLKAEVDGNLVLDRDVSVERDDIRVEFLRDQAGRLGHIAVSMKVDPEAFRTSVETDQGQSAPTVVLGGDPQIYQTLVREMQRLESDISFKCKNSLKQIHWDTAKEQWIPENPEERSLCAISEFRLEKGYPDSQVRLGQGFLEMIVAELPRYDSLMIPKAFAREMMNGFSTLRYIHSFYNAFFILEGFYGKGKSSLKNLLRDFSGSGELRSVTSWALDAVYQKYEQHRVNLDQFYAEENCTTDVDGTLKLLIKVRGNLHHYYSRSSKRQVDPFNQGQFRSVSYLIMGMAKYAIGLKEVSINHEETEQKMNGDAGSGVPGQ